LWRIRAVAFVTPRAPFRLAIPLQGSAASSAEHSGTASLLPKVRRHDCVLESCASFVSGFPPGLGGVAW
jgi:hypothetical protein